MLFLDLSSAGWNAIVAIGSALAGGVVVLASTWVQGVFAARARADAVATADRERSMVRDQARATYDAGRDWRKQLRLRESIEKMIAHGESLATPNPTPPESLPDTHRYTAIAAKAQVRSSPWPGLADAVTELRACVNRLSREKDKLKTASEPDAFGAALQAFAVAKEGAIRTMDDIDLPDEGDLAPP